MEKLIESIPKPSWRHLPFWMMYWIYASVQSLPFYNHFLSNLVTESGNIVVIASCVYINFLFLIPRFLIQQRYVIYAILLIGISFVSSWLINEFYVLLLYPVEVDFFSSWQGKMVLFTDIILMIAFTTAIYFVLKWKERDRYVKELERKNLETELALLKSQVNPHFIFNILNTIYHLIAKSPHKAQHVLVQFSDILSHQIYDSAKAQIELDKEISYLKKYIEIEQLRSGDLLDLKYELPEVGQDKQIAPMLILPLIENAFKHSKSAHGSKVFICMTLNENQLRLEIENSMNGNKNSSAHHGLGLPNVSRRLELLYPGRHEFQVQKDENQQVFYTYLTINLDEAKVSDYR